MTLEIQVWDGHKIIFRRIRDLIKSISGRFTIQYQSNKYCLVQGDNNSLHDPLGWVS
jgi:hypothetical protein